MFLSKSTLSFSQTLCYQNLFSSAVTDPNEPRHLFSQPPIVEEDPPTMTLFSANSSTMFRTIKLRKRKAECIMCGDSPTITKLIDYVRFCGSSATDKTPDLFLIPYNERITCQV